MKEMLKVILIAFFSIIYSQLFSQESCKVLKPEISVNYEGKCKKGLAHGKGLATGKDRYEGDFKNGLPHGKGKYTWLTGEIYDGGWKEGKKDGMGKYSYKKNGVDSLKVGIWRNDAFYKKVLPAPYRVIRSSSVTRNSVQKLKEGNKVLFSFMQNGGTNTYISSVLFSQSSGSTFTLGAKQGFENVEFPFNCRVTYKTLNSLKTMVIDAEFEVEIKEPGYWEIILNN